MSEITNFLAANKTPIILMLMSAPVVAHLAWRNNKKTRNATACIKFREEVLKTLIGLYPTPTNWPKEKHEIIKLLKEKFPQLEVAVVEFRMHLPIWKRPFFNRAWNIYLNGGQKKTGENHGYWQYVPYKSESIENGKQRSHDNMLTYQENFKRNVARLLSYANET